MVTSGADLGKDGAGLVSFGHDQGKDARTWSTTMATRPASIGTMPSSTSSMGTVAAGKPRAAAEQGQSGAEQGQSSAEEGWIGAEEGWIGAGLVKAGAEKMKTAAEQVWNATVLAWSRAVWPSMAAKRVKTPAVPGYSRAGLDRAGAEEARIDCGIRHQGRGSGLALLHLLILNGARPPCLVSDGCG